jgi:hypothetical protein
MEKIYKYRNGTIYVTIPDACDRDKLRQVTEVFLKKVMYGGTNNGNSNTRKNFRKK